MTVVMKIDLVGPLRYRPVDKTSLDAVGDQEPISSIAAPDYQKRGEQYQAETRRAGHVRF